MKKLKDMKADWDSADCLGDEATPEMVPFLREYLIEQGVSEDDDINSVPCTLWTAAVDYAAGKVEDQP